MRVMIDLETLSLHHDAAIVALGACAFDHTKKGSAQIERVFYSCIALDVERFHVDSRTLSWWMHQPDGPRLSTFMNNSPSLEGVLHAFNIWLFDRSSNELEIWGNGAHADNVWLANAYTTLGREVPWEYRANRCYRTIKALFPNIKEPDGKDSIQHNALDDAIFQARHLCSILRHLEKIN